MNAHAQLKTEVSPPAKSSGASSTPGLLRRKCACGGGAAGVSGDCEECSEKRLQRKPARTETLGVVPPIVHEVLRSSGEPLDAATRGLMETRFGHDFSRVRVHTDARAAESARSVNALAYTAGSHIAFGEGQPAPGTTGGLRTLAHELAHVVQQERGGPPTSPLRGDMLERAADDAASAFVSGRGAISVGGAGAPGLARQPLSGGPGLSADKPQSLTGSLDVKNLTDARLEREIELIQQWLEDNPFAPESDHLRSELEALRAEELRRKGKKDDENKSERRVTAAPECGKYEPGERAKSYTPQGILHFDAGFARNYGLSKVDGVVVGDFGVDDARLKASTQGELLKDFWIGYHEDQTTGTLEILGFSDCVGEESRNVSLRQKRAEAVARMFPKSKPRINTVGAAPAQEYLADNTSERGRALNRSVLIVNKQPAPPPVPVPTPTPAPQPPVCTPPAPQSSSGKRCKFYVYDNTEPTGMAWKWEAAALALATFRPGAYVVTSGDTIAEALEHIINSNATEGCDCIEEVQFFSHGSPGNAMSISKSNEEITVADFNIPDLDKFGYGPTSMPGYREWRDRLTVRQRRMVLLRRLLCGPDAEIYYRSCEAFQGPKGKEFAEKSTEFWRSNVVGHTKIIGLTQPGKKTLKPCQEPYWPESEGVGPTTGKIEKKKPPDVKPSKD